MVRRERVKPYCLFTGCLPAPPRIPVFCCTTSSSLPYLIAIAACAVAFRFGARTGGGRGELEADVARASFSACSVTVTPSMRCDAARSLSRIC